MPLESPAPQPDMIAIFLILLSSPGPGLRADKMKVAELCLGHAYLWWELTPSLLVAAPSLPKSPQSLELRPNGMRAVWFCTF